MTTLRLNGIAAGLALALAYGDSGKASPAAARTEAPPSKGVTRTSQLPDLCALLTETEAEAILGKKLGPPQRQAGGACWYLNEGGSGFGDAQIVLSVLPVRIGSESEFDAFIAKQVKDLSASMEKAGMAGFTAEPVREVGAPAYYVDLPSLFVLRGDRVLTIAADRPQAVAIAAKALPRFQ